MLKLICWVTHDIYSLRSHCSGTTKVLLCYFIPTMFTISLKNKSTPCMCQTVLKNNCWSLSLSTSYVEFLKTVHTPEPESICHPNRIVWCHESCGSTLKGCIQYKIRVVTKLSSRRNVKYSAPLPTPQRSLPLLRPSPRSQKFMTTTEGIVGFV